jgi:hypothetical protein
VQILEEIFLSMNDNALKEIDLQNIFEDFLNNE